MPIINILWQLVAGTRISKEDVRAAKILNSVNDLFAEGLITVWLMLPYPLLKLFPHATGYKRLGDKFDSLRDYMLETVKQHQDTLDEAYPRDYIDVYLTTMQKEGEHKYTLVQKLLSCGQKQELCQKINLASDWLIVRE